MKWDQMAAATLRNVPGVQATALENWPLLSGLRHNDRVSVKGSPPSNVLSFFLEVSPGWLDAMRIRRVDGRDFRENGTAPSVVILNEAFAKQYFSGRSPLGHSFDTRPAFGPSLHYEIVGLVKDVMYCNVREQVLPQEIFPLGLQSNSGKIMVFERRVRSDGVVVNTPAFGKNLHFLQRVKDLTIEELVFVRAMTTMPRARQFFIRSPKVSLSLSHLLLNCSGI